MKNKEILNRVHDFLGKVVRDCPDQEMGLEASDLADDVWDVLHATEGVGEMTNENNVYRKYRILDAGTGEEKHGKYFVLKIDAKDKVERECVKAAMNMYTMAHMNRGNTDYARAVDDYILGKTEGGAA